MDPTSNLLEQLMLARRIVAISEAVAQLQESDDSVAAADAIKRLAAERTEAADRLAELVLALDEWARKGGALPERWLQKDPCHYCGQRDPKGAGGHCSGCGAG